MGWFKLRSSKVPPAKVEREHDSRVEVVVHQNATKQAIAQAKKTNEDLNELLLDNGFTLKIYLATGGTIKKRGTNGP